MSEVDEIGPLLARAIEERTAKQEAELERLARRAGWGKAAVASAFSVLITVAGAGWWFRGIVEDLRRDIATMGVEIHYLREHIDAVQNTAIEAKKSGDTAQMMMFALKGGAPPLGRP